jgi:hypothetical protein
VFALAQALTGLGCSPTGQDALGQADAHLLAVEALSPWTNEFDQIGASRRACCLLGFLADGHLINAAKIRATKAVERAVECLNRPNTAENVPLVAAALLFLDRQLAILPETETSDSGGEKRKKLLITDALKRVVACLHAHGERNRDLTEFGCGCVDNSS